MINIDALMKELHLDAKLSNDNIPELDLYMDQVIQIFEQKFHDTKRTSEEKIITKTMINNYSKGKLFFPVKNKKYTREHIMLIHMIYEMKTVLSMRDIKQALDGLNQAFVNQNFNIEEFYKKFTEMTDENVEYFEQEGIELDNRVKEKSNELEGADEAYYEQLLLILSFVNRSNIYRRAAELLVDKIIETNKSTDTSN